MTGIDLSAIEADLASAPKVGNSRNQCSVQALVRDHPEAEKTIRDAIAATRYSAATIASVLTKNGLKIGETTIRRHRQGDCKFCNREG